MHVSGKIPTHRRVRTRMIKRAILAALFLAFTPLIVRAADPVQGTVVKFATGDGKELLGYRSYGTHGPTVVILSGGPGLNALHMESVAQIIAADGYRAILFDQRGTGLSAAAGAATDKLTMQGTVDDIELLRKNLAQEKLTFFTHSFGGALALAYSAAHPQNVAKLILCGSPGTDLATLALVGKRLNERMTAEEQAQYAAALKSNNDNAALNIQLQAQFDDRDKARDFIKSLPQPFFYPAVSGAIYTDFNKNFHVGKSIGAYHGYVALLTGSDDAVLVLEPGLLKAFPDATVVHIANSGHWPWLENPKQFNPALKAALAMDHFAQ
jgi:proline iminopeptidase